MAPLVVFSEEKSPSIFHTLGGLVTVVSDRELFAINVMPEGEKCRSISENDETRGKTIGDEVSQADTQTQTSDFGLLQ
ncbi:hypothetical protein FRB91_010478 [Serendipita sp. 411]|nr:hypothetical protein FRB91_010478 [Serendipita sp. 411]